MEAFTNILKENSAKIKALLEKARVTYHFQPQTLEEKYEALKTEADEMRHLAERTLWMCEAVIAGDKAVFDEAMKIHREQIDEIGILESALDEACTAMEWSLEIIPNDAWQRKYIVKAIDTAKTIEQDRRKKLGVGE